MLIIKCVLGSARQLSGGRDLQDDLVQLEELNGSRRDFGCSKLVL